MSTTLPAADVSARALLVVAGQIERSLRLQQAVELGRILLPRTGEARVTEVLLGVSDHLRRSQIYAAATPQDASRWFGNCGCDHETAASFAQCLHERSAVWKGEAETLATTAVLQDRMIPSLAWKEPA